MTTASDPIKILARANPVEPGSLRKVAAERADGLLSALRANQVAAPSLRSSHPPRRMIGAAAVAIAAAVVVVAALFVTLNPGQGAASPIRQATPLSQANLTGALRRSILHVVLDDGVNPRSVVVLGGTGKGRQSHAVLTGTNASGATVLSFLDGFGMSAFVSSSRFADASNPMFVSDTVSGPSTQARIVGITGIATQDVARVTLELANGSTLTLPVDQAPGIPYEGFSYVSTHASTFPVTVTAYDASGHVAAKHQVDATALCKSSQPNCAG
jgi:hypothetical protein